MSASYSKDKIKNAYFAEYHENVGKRHPFLRIVDKFSVPLSGAGLLGTMAIIVGIGVSAASGVAPLVAVGAAVLGLTNAGVAMFCGIGVSAACMVVGAVCENVLRRRVNQALDADIASGALVERYKEELLPKELQEIETAKQQVFNHLEQTRAQSLDNVRKLDEKGVALKRSFGLAVVEDTGASDAKIRSDAPKFNGGQ